MEEEKVNLYVAIFLIIVSTLLQAEFLPAILPGLNQFLPDLTLLVVITWSLVLRWQWALPLSFGMGLLLDFMNPATHLVGLNSLIYTLASLIVGLVSHKRYSSGVVWAVPITFAVAFCYRLLLLLGQRVMGYNNLQLNLITQVVIPNAIIDAALMLLVYVVVKNISSIGAPPDSDF